MAGPTRSPCDNRAVGTVQEVRIAKRTGFCYGVREAIDMAKEARAAGKQTHTLGQVVHNEGVIQDLIPPGTDRRAAKTQATELIMRRIADLLPERQRGRYGSTSG